MTEFFYDFRIGGEHRGFSYLTLTASRLFSLTRFLIEADSLYGNRFELQLDGGRVLRCRHDDAEWVDFSAAGTDAWPSCAYQLILDRAREDEPYRYTALSEDNGHPLTTLTLVRRGNVIDELDGAQRKRQFVLEGDVPTKIDWGGAESHLCASGPDSVAGSGVPFSSV